MNEIVSSPTTPEVEIQDLLHTVSASRLNTFHTCRLQFFFRYVEKLPKRKTPAQHIGSTVHHLLKLWNLSRWRRQVVPDDWMRQQFDLFWQEDQDNQITWDDGEEVQAKNMAWQLIDTYFKHSPIPPNEPAEGVEVSVDANLGLTRLIGIIDLVRAGGKIVEFKTAAQTPNPERAEHMHELQCSCYAVLYREATAKVETGIELHHLVKLKTPKLVITTLPPMTDRQHSRLMRVVESYLEGVQRRDWVPSPSPMACACCEFFKQCRQWS